MPVVAVRHVNKAVTDADMNTRTTIPTHHPHPPLSRSLTTSVAVLNTTSAAALSRDEAA